MADAAASHVHLDARRGPRSKAWRRFIASRAGVVGAWILGVLLTVFEGLIQFLQAYVFTLLAASYIGGALADEH